MQMKEHMTTQPAAADQLHILNVNKIRRQVSPKTEIFSGFGLAFAQPAFTESHLFFLGNTPQGG